MLKYSDAREMIKGELERLSPGLCLGRLDFPDIHQAWIDRAFQELVEDGYAEQNPWGFTTYRKRL